MLDNEIYYWKILIQKLPVALSYSKDYFEVSVNLILLSNSKTQTSVYWEVGGK